MGVCVSKPLALTAGYTSSPVATPSSLVTAAARSNGEVAADDAEVKCRKTVPKLRSNSNSSKVTSLIAKWKKNNVLSLIQSHVLAVSSTQKDSLEELSVALSQFSHLVNISEQYEVQTAKAYAIFLWITTNVKYDKAAWVDSFTVARVPSTDPIDVLTKREALSEGFSALFQCLASHANLKAVTIRGYERAGRIPGRGSGTTRFVQNEENAHTWNAVEIDDAWVLLDSSYGPRSVAHGWQAVDCLSQYYFAVPSEHMIFTHWPEDQCWQLLEKKFDFSDIELLVAPHAGVFALGISAITCCEQVELKADLPGPVVHVELNAPPSLSLSASLAGDDVSKPLETARQCGENRTTYIHREEGEKVHIYVLCPAVGKYSLQIFARLDLLDPQMFCLLYYVTNHTPGNEYCECPAINSIAAAAFKFQLLSWNAPQMPFIAKNESGKMDVIFKAAQNLKFHHYIVPNKHARDPSDALYYYTHIARHKSDPQCCLMQVLFPKEGWWSVFIWCSSDSVPDGSTSGYTLVASIRMYACAGIRQQTFPRVVSSTVTFDNGGPIASPDGDILHLPFRYSSGSMLEAYITRDSTQDAQPLVDYATVEDLKSDRFLLHAVLPQPGKWEVCVVAKKPSDPTATDVLLFQLLVDVDQGLKNTVFPYLFTASAAELGVKLIDSKPVTYSGDGGILSLSFEAPHGLEFQHGILLASNPEADPKMSNSHVDYCTYLDCPSDLSNLHTLHCVLPSLGVWSVVVYARKRSSGSFYQIISINNLEITAVPQNAQCYPKLNPATCDAGVCFDCLPLPSVLQQPEFRLPFSAPGSLYFSCSMNLESSEECTFDHAFVHVVDDGKYLLHVVFPKPGVWLIYVNAVCSTADNEEAKLLFQLKLKAVESLPNKAFPQVFRPFYSTFKMSMKDVQLPLLQRVKQVPFTLVIPFSCPSDVLLWHLAHVNDVAYQSATQIPPSSGPEKHELVVDFSKSGKWVITLYAQHAGAENKTEWTPVLRHAVSVGRSHSTNTM